MITANIIDPDALNNGSGYYRSFLVNKFCKEYLESIGIQLNLITYQNPVYSDIKADIVLFRRVLNPMAYVWLDLLQLDNIPYIIDIDDLLLQMPSSNPSYANLTWTARQTHELMLARSKVITCTNAHLRDNLKFKDKTLIFPNLIDLPTWEHPKLPTHANAAQPGAERVILYQGGDSHDKDIEIVIDALKWIVSERSDVFVYFCGCAPQWNHERVFKFSWQPIPSFSRFMKILRPDVCLCPLVNNRFNQCKSNIKWMEGILAGGVVVSTPFGPYEKVGGLQNEWYKDICTYLDYPNFAQEHWKMSMDLIKTEYSWQGTAGKNYAQELGKLILNLTEFLRCRKPPPPD